MDVNIITCLKNDQALKIHHAISALGCNNQLHYWKDIINNSVDITESFNVLYLEKKCCDEYFNENIKKCSSRPYDIVFIDSTELVNSDFVIENALDVCMWPTQFSELELRLLRSSLTKNQPDPVDLVSKNLCMQSNMVGCSAAFKQLIYQINQYSENSANVLIYGETGTGKELAAKAIHYTGVNTDGPFQAVNCGALPDYLIENELFGHVKGAYTDASMSQPGIIEQAKGGTLFLDEIDALSFKAQSSLLRFLQDQTYRPLGSGKNLQASVRVIAATNANLDDCVVAGSFRKDLLYRLNVLPLEIPSLKVRKEDLPLLIKYFLNQCEKEFKKGMKVFHPLCVRKMQSHNWPGNIRELSSFIQRSYLLSRSHVIVADPQNNFFNHVEVPEQESLLSCFSKAKAYVVTQFERDYVTGLLMHTHGNVTNAAVLAGKERRAFGKLMKKHDIDRSKYV